MDDTDNTPLTVVYLHRRIAHELPRTKLRSTVPNPRGLYRMVSSDVLHDLKCLDQLAGILAYSAKAAGYPVGSFSCNFTHDPICPSVTRVGVIPRRGLRGPARSRRAK